jgi:hypothetical protein
MDRIIEMVLGVTSKGKPCPDEYFNFLLQNNR